MSIAPLSATDERNRPLENGNYNEEPISVVIATYNKRELLRGCLQSLLSSDYPRFEVIVVDNASTDGTATMVEGLAKSDLRLKLLQNHANKGPSAAYNSAIEIANGDYIAILDDDAIVSPNWLSSQCAILTRENNVGAVQSFIIPIKDPRDAFHLSRRPNHLSIDYLGIGTKNAPAQTGQDVFYLNTCGCMIRKNVFQTAGGFDPTYFVYMFELDFGWRIRLAGYRIVFCASPAVYHVRQQFSMQRMRKKSIFEYRKNHAMTLLKNYDGWNAIRYAPPYVLFALLQGAYYSIFKREPVYLGSSAEAISWLIKNTRHLYKERLKVQKVIRKIPDQDIMELLNRPRIPFELLQD